MVSAEVSKYILGVPQRGEITPVSLISVLSRSRTRRCLCHTFVAGGGVREFYAHAYEGPLK
jgi:hypothetical protein